MRLQKKINIMPSEVHLVSLLPYVLLSPMEASQEKLVRQLVTLTCCSYEKVHASLGNKSLSRQNQ